MNFLLENPNKLSWLAGDWLEQDKDNMKVYSGGFSCNLPTASVRVASPVVDDILSSQPGKQFSLVLPPELVFGYEELGSLEAFLTSGKMPPLPLEQTKKMKSFLEETCGSQIQLAVSKSKIYNNNVKSSIVEPMNIIKKKNDIPNIETVPRESTDEVPPVQVDPTSQKEKKFHEGAVAETPSHPSSRFKCSCDRSFPNKNQLGEHKERSFPNKNKLGEHKEREHLGLVYKCGRLGIPWSQPLPTPQLNSQSVATAYMEKQTATVAVKQEVVKLEDELQAQEKAEEKESKEKGGRRAGDWRRCGFCRCWCLMPVTEKIKHQAGHLSSSFSCAACSGLIGGLKMFKCGVVNCGKTFYAQPELRLRNHMAGQHGSYFIKAGKGKFILRHCRICGKERCFPSEKELETHIMESHPSESTPQSRVTVRMDL